MEETDIMNVWRKKTKIKKISKNITVRLKN